MDLCFGRGKRAPASLSPPRFTGTQDASPAHMLYRRQSYRKPLSASPATSLVIEAEMLDAIAHLLSDGDRLRSEHDLPPGCEVAKHWMAPGLDRFPYLGRPRGYESRSNSPVSILATPGGLRWAPFYPFLASTRVAPRRAPTPTASESWALA